MFEYIGSMIVNSFEFFVGFFALYIIANYHGNLIEGIKNITDLNRGNLTFRNENGEIYFDIDIYFHQKFHHLKRAYAKLRD